jgi:hypothetical protein
MQDTTNFIRFGRGWSENMIIYIWGAFYYRLSVNKVGISYSRDAKPECQHETVRKETILMYLNTPDFFIPYFSF